MQPSIAATGGRGGMCNKAVRSGRFAGGRFAGVVALYVSVGILAVGGVAGVLAEFAGGTTAVIVVLLTCLGILCLIYASVELIRESLLSLRIIEHHLDDVMVQEEELREAS